MKQSDPSLARWLVAPALRFPNTAILLEDNSVDIPDVTLVGTKHYDKIMSAQLANIGGDIYSWRYKTVYPEEGFIDQRQQFWNRYDAWKIALQTQQLVSTNTLAHPLTVEILFPLNKGNRVLCAANAYGDELFCIAGARHFDLIMHSQIQNLANTPEVRKLRTKCPTQGFLDLEGNFLDRKEALDLATTVGQIGNGGRGKTFPEYELFSEDIY